MSTAKFNTWRNKDGTENYKCRAWVNFNGTGTVAIRAAGNVSSITDNGTGDYTVNFTNAMPDANYVWSASARIDTSAADANFPIFGSARAAETASSFRVLTVLRTVATTVGTLSDVDAIRVIVVR